MILFPRIAIYTFANMEDQQIRIAGEQNATFVTLGLVSMYINTVNRFVIPLIPGVSCLLHEMK